MKFEVQLEREGDSELFEDLARYLKYRPKLARFLLNPAGFTFLFGWFLFLGMTIGWIAIWLLDPDVAYRMAITVGTEMFPGKEAAIPVGLALGLHPVIVFGIVAIQDLITTTWVYPAFYLFRRHQAGRATFFGYFFDKVERNAKRHEDFIRRYGGWGIFLFMLIPFAVNGPLIGAIVGKLAGVRTRYILPAVLGATAVSTGLWTLLWVVAENHVRAFVERYGGGWIAAGVILVFALFLAKNALDFVRDLRRFRALQAERAAIVRRDFYEQTLHLGEASEGRDVNPPKGPSHLDE